MDRQSELKKSILELEIENGNLMDLKNQLVRELRQSELSAFKSRNEWGIWLSIIFHLTLNRYELLLNKLEP